MSKFQNILKWFVGVILVSIVCCANLRNYDEPESETSARKRTSSFSRFPQESSQSSAHHPFSLATARASVELSETTEKLSENIWKEDADEEAMNKEAKIPTETLKGANVDKEERESPVLKRDFTPFGNILPSNPSVFPVTETNHSWLKNDQKITCSRKSDASCLESNVARKNQTSETNYKTSDRRVSNNESVQSADQLEKHLNIAGRSFYPKQVDGIDRNEKPSDNTEDDVSFGRRSTNAGDNSDREEHANSEEDEAVTHKSLNEDMNIGNANSDHIFNETNDSNHENEPNDGKSSHKEQNRRNNSLKGETILMKTRDSYQRKSIHEYNLSNDKTSSDQDSDIDEKSTTVNHYYPKNKVTIAPNSDTNRSSRNQETIKGRSNQSEENNSKKGKHYKDKSESRENNSEEEKDSKDENDSKEEIDSKEENDSKEGKASNDENDSKDENDSMEENDSKEENDSREENDSKVESSYKKEENFKNVSREDRSKTKIENSIKPEENSEKEEALINEDNYKTKRISQNEEKSKINEDPQGRYEDETANEKVAFKWRAFPEEVNPPEGEGVNDYYSYNRADNFGNNKVYRPILDPQSYHPYLDDIAIANHPNLQTSSQIISPYNQNEDQNFMRLNTQPEIRNPESQIFDRVIPNSFNPENIYLENLDLKNLDFESDPNIVNINDNNQEFQYKRPEENFGFAAEQNFPDLQEESSPGNAFSIMSNENLQTTLNPSFNYDIQSRIADSSSSQNQPIQDNLFLDTFQPLSDTPNDAIPFYIPPPSRVVTQRPRIFLNDPSLYFRADEKLPFESESEDSESRSKRSWHRRSEHYHQDHNKADDWKEDQIMYQEFINQINQFKNRPTKTTRMYKKYDPSDANRNRFQISLIGTGRSFVEPSILGIHRDFYGYLNNKEVDPMPIEIPEPEYGYLNDPYPIINPRNMGLLEN